MGVSENLWRWLLILSAICCSLVSTDLMELAKRTAQSLKSQSGEELTQLQEMLEISDDNKLVVKSREKRLIFLPKGLNKFAIKWQVDLPMKTFTRYTAVVQFAIIPVLFFPSEFIQDTDKPTYAQIMNSPTIYNYDTKEEDKEGLEFRKRHDHTRQKRAMQSERHRIYSTVEGFIKELGLPPRDCLLRSLCEVAEMPFDDDLLGLLINTLFSPSRAGEDTDNEDYYDFLEAERHGKMNGSCEVKYSHCPSSVFTQVPFLKHQIVYK